MNTGPPPTGTVTATSTTAANNTVSFTVSAGATSTHTTQMITPVPMGFSWTGQRFWATEATIKTLTKGFWPKGRFHLRETCPTLKDKSPGCIDGGLRQSMTRTSNWMLILGGEPVARICSACARRVLKEPETDRPNRAALAAAAVQSAKANP